MTSLVAIVANAHRNPSIEFEVAHEVNGEWHTNYGFRVWPFWTMHIDDVLGLNELMIPPGWIKYLLTEVARHYDTERHSLKEDSESGTSLLSSLGLPTKVHPSVSGPLKRRI